MAWSRDRGYLACVTAASAIPLLPKWRIMPGLSDYGSTLAEMEAHVEQMARGQASEEIWLVEHPPVLTAGTSSASADLLQPDRFPVFATGRGGQFTYHGPGQRVVYPLLDLSQRGRDVRRYVAGLEAWAIAALADLGVVAGISRAGTGIWVEDAAQIGRLLKIGAIGVRVRRWISFHGMALNVSTDLSHFDAIVPCGIVEHGVTRIVDLKPGVDMPALDHALFNRLPILLHSLSDVTLPRIKTLEDARDCS
jgi:lipoyl(octanoyl) transferase